MRAVPVNDPVLPAGWAAQPKWDGYRALARRWADGRVRSRNGSDLTQAFPEIKEAVRRLPDDTAIDCELIVWEAAAGSRSSDSSSACTTAARPPPARPSHNPTHRAK
jgi:ATP-dependent DNA ligase